MTRKQFDEIKESLKQWREARHLTIDGQKEGLKKNLKEEFKEYLNAEAEGDTFGMLDALCDAMVLILNADEVYEIEDYFNQTIPYTIEGADGYDWLVSHAGNVNFITADSLEHWDRIIRKLGFDPYLAMSETLKEIHSRDGKWSEEAKKFLKSKGAYSLDEAQALVGGVPLIGENEHSWCFGYGREAQVIIKWYKADYEKARLKK